MREFLLMRYDGYPRLEELVEDALKKLAEEIRTQTGKEPNLHFSEPSKEVKAKTGKFGTYSEIHVLRSFAARISGYTLDEAYRLEDKRLALLCELPEDEDGETELEGENGDEDEEEESSESCDFREYFGVDVEEVFPPAKDRVDPFPYPQMVCFSDAGGIYLPIDFPRPFIFGETDSSETFVGSSTRLLVECDELGIRLAERLYDAMRQTNEGLENYLLYARQLWWRLREPCQVSVKATVPFTFE